MACFHIPGVQCDSCGTALRRAPELSYSDASWSAGYAAGYAAAGKERDEARSEVERLTRESRMP